MKLRTEIASSRQKILLIAQHNSRFLQLLKSEIAKFDISIFISPDTPENLSIYSAVFFIDEAPLHLPEFVSLNPSQKFIFLLFHKTKEAQAISRYIDENRVKHLKVISLETAPSFLKDDIDSILWFAFSRSQETFLHIFHPKLTSSKKTIQPRKVAKMTFKQLIATLTKPKTLITYSFIGLAILHVLFIPPLILASFLNVWAGHALMAKNVPQSQTYATAAASSLDIGQSLYVFSRPTLLLFSIAQVPDNVFELNYATNQAVFTSIKLYNHLNPMLSALFTSQRTRNEEATFLKQKQAVLSDFSSLKDNMNIIADKMPIWNSSLKAIKKQLTDLSKTLTALNTILPHLDSLMAKNENKTYLLMFANNMELRPGGGFIGSFALVTVKNYAVVDIQIYDVYDADGQLTDHVSPPNAIAKYLNQPNWFFRDSAFSPDFYQNYQKAKFFLDNEMGIDNLDGGILLTTSAIQNLLQATGDLDIPDFQETVNKDNFYLKAQLYAESEFFPGSQQKKRFLGSVMNQLILTIADTSPLKLFEMVKKSLDEKQMVIYVDNPQVQQSFDELYWSGRTLSPTCSQNNQGNCIVDFLFPFDANLGVNKANFYITRPIALATSISEDGTISHVLTLKYKNNSFADVFPGGRYKNYLQILLPLHSTVRKITQNNTLVEEFDQRDEEYKIIGFLSEVPPQSESEIKIEYFLFQKFSRGSGTYQLVLQKQIGSPNSDFQLNIKLPSNLYVSRENFSPLVKDRRILYNTTISSDKIFIIEFYKE